ncbi:MAG TPA: helix-hairpin-helix domain-containing protein [Tepidisphaeraceae bacterium]|jgi:competence ComEA-like helix-hairpin-helix protein|nr:helix-hairpin-helix domain-containing protein [Tepidisphaeraceae bacterium]
MEKAPPHFIWTPGQLSAIAGLLLVLVIVLGGRLICNRTFIDDPQPDIPARAHELADRLDPNTASWQELAAISGLGEKRAHAIVAYRDTWHKKHPNTPAYAGPQDLRNIKGIGPATVSNLTPYLIFPKEKEK